MKIGYLGPAGTYTERALELYMPDAEKKALQSISKVFQETASKQVDLGFVPIENVIQGPVTETLDNLLDFVPHIQIVDATVLDIMHALGALPGHGEIKRILSKDTALDQCSKYLNEIYPNAERVPVNSTSGAMEMIAAKQLMDSAAIGMESSFTQYGLEVLATNIGNRKSNKTRFIVLGSQDSQATGNDVTSIAIYPRRDRVGLLSDMLRVIGREYGLNLSSIHSRPDGKGQFIFYIDIQGHKSDEKVQGCISSIKTVLPDTDVTVLGSYRYLPFNEPLIKTIGIIGGTGKMGKWFVPFYEGLGYKVLVAGRKTKLTHEECTRQSDAVIVNVPIEQTPGIIRKIGPLMRKGQLLVDNTGVKSKSVGAMLESTAPDVEILSIHTMFGENTGELRGENVISIHTERSGEMAQEFENTLHKYGARITSVTAEEHDGNAILTQGLEHAISVAREATILEIAGHPDKLQPFSTPNSRMSHTIDGRVHGADFRLYGTMLRENPHAVKALKVYTRNLNSMIKRLEKGDSSVFEKMMAHNARALGKDFIAKKTTVSKKIEKDLKEGE